MEVQNTRHSSKHWKEYLKDFLMLFAAVTLGFVAENYREDSSEALQWKWNMSIHNGRKS